MLLTSLYGLHNLSHIGGNINIQENESLTDLSAFSNIDTINGDLKIKSNQQLRELIGFEFVLKIKDSLQIFHNPQLLSLNFEQLKSVVSQISIINNDRLKHFDGFEHITLQIGGIRIMLNDSLMDYHGFENLANLKSELYISNNPMALDFSGFESLREVDDLILDNLPCRNLTGLSALHRVRGNLEIGLNSKMESLLGAPSLEKIDGILIIYKVNRLIDLEGMNQLQEIRDLQLEKNDSISSLQGLNGLKKINGNILIKDNPQLQDLSALLGASGLMYNLTITQNDKLQSLYGLDHLCISPIEEVTIEDNPNLSVCNNECLCAHLIQGGISTISGNSPGCNTSDEIIASCLVRSNETESTSTIQVYPNPTSQWLEINGLQKEPFQYTLIDEVGQYITNNLSDQPILDIQYLPHGLYQLRIQQDNHISFHRIVKF
jgi:hypothetical protein